MMGAFAATLILASIFLVSGHPQCLDAGPPFTPKYNHTFCTMYTDFGCCTPDHDKELKQRYQKLKGVVKPECLNYLKTLMCQDCSPYAAHIFDFEATLVKKPLPGLCQGYCEKVYDKCNDMISLMTDDVKIKNVINSKDRFCEDVRPSDNDYCYPELLTNDILNREITPAGRTAKGCLCLEKFAEDMSNPVIFRVPPDGSERVFIGEQKGIIHIYHKNKAKLEEPFLDIQNIVLTSNYKGDERGLLGMAFHPEFKDNQLFYLFLSTRQNGGTGHMIKVAEFRVSRSNPNKADNRIVRTILDVPQPFFNHNGGEIFFGFDGYMYLSFGDGGYKGDPYNFAQNKTTLLGKILRIDVNTGSKRNPYRIPPDNPFVNEKDEQIKKEIFAYGLRNAWRCDLDEGDPDTGHGKGRIMCADVGQDKFEEVDLIVKGGNYGWNAKEGFECFKKDICGKIGPEVDPVFAYPHSVGKSVIGGHFYRGCAYPNLNGQYLYGDFVSGRLFSLTENLTDGTWSNREITLCGTDICLPQLDLVDRYETNILSFGEDDEGEVYMLTTSFASTGSPRGKVYKFVDPRRRDDPGDCHYKTNPPYTGPTRPVTPVVTDAQSTPDVATVAASIATEKSTQIVDIPGTCPAVTSDQVGTCEHECQLHSQCMTGEKCCYNGCGNTCQYVGGGKNMQASLVTVLMISVLGAFSCW